MDFKSLKSQKWVFVGIVLTVVLVPFLLFKQNTMMGDRQSQLIYEKSLKMNKEQDTDSKINTKIKLAYLDTYGSGTIKKYGAAFDLLQSALLDLTGQKGAIDLDRINPNEYPKSEWKRLGQVLQELDCFYRDGKNDQGEGPNRDLKKAEAFFQKAIEFGNQKAKKKVNHPPAKDGWASCFNDP
ncbi:hypothetical protein NHP190003_01400 [Helicobacter sp. NHP19-003]|uniref:Beta-lactamase n=1 Tax=Helicobacter gastrocanis TaxID=2849641 RepID=A0ABM7SA51_9HELI|nr:hypothetical protein [Helicobacter sp. NHP19-003]BCZ16858.1 hypothetical protein NHP190003_01400 [Helicobacter sp. NHP19-003]